MDAKKKKALESDLKVLHDMQMRPNFAELARHYGMDYRTIKKYYDNGGKVPQRKKRIQFSRWDPYEAEITHKYQVEGATIRAIHDEYRKTLPPDQLPGTYASLKAFINKKGLKKGKTNS
ncbi:hypothetical protein AAK899_04405 [Erysipelotrichaceae bacterium 51-3]|uniref:hypothetical protein n=1 Tax=Allobaculum sp. JKK-2023 TaxID=3108943 RepID=UPI002B06138A|nr:hypothetical protein [Allobaculum sp. JKK-2023]